MSMTSANKRRSLKGALRTILSKCRRQTLDDVSGIVGSGILRRDPSLPTLPNDSTAAFLMGVESIKYDEYDSHDIPDRFDISSLATSAAMSSTRNLMPKMSLSQFDIYHPPIQETRYLGEGRRDSVSSSLVDGASYQASLITLRSFRSSSTLRIQSSSQTLRSDSDQSCSLLSFPERIDYDLDQPYSTTILECPSPPRFDHNISPKRSLLRKKGSMRTLVSPSPLRQTIQPSFDLDGVNSSEYTYPIPYDYSSRFSRPLSVIEEVASYVDEPSTPRYSPTPSYRDKVGTPTARISAPPTIRPASVKSDRAHSLYSVKHFSSFCALDMVNPGHPVTATSKDLNYIFEIGDNFCLNNHGVEGVSMDVITGSDAAGKPVTHLAILNPLIIPHSGRSRFMLASLVDITDFLQDNASLPELEMVSEEPADSDPPTPVLRSQYYPKAPRYQLSAESLLGGCFVEELRTPLQRNDEDVWINLATEERKQYSKHSKMSNGSRSPISAVSTLSSIDDVLETFMCKLQELYSDFFLLAKSPLDDNYYEICNVSPRVYEKRDYVNGHLSKTSATAMSKLSGHLAGDEAFDMSVKWGTEALAKHLYCIPLYARSAVTWICFLVDGGTPPLW